MFSHFYRDQEHHGRTNRQNCCSIYCRYAVRRAVKKTADLHNDNGTIIK